MPSRSWALSVQFSPTDPLVARYFLIWFSQAVAQAVTFESASWRIMHLIVCIPPLSNGNKAFIYWVFALEHSRQFHAVITLSHIAFIKKRIDFLLIPRPTGWRGWGRHVGVDFGNLRVPPRGQNGTGMKFSLRYWKRDELAQVWLGSVVIFSGGIM